MSGPTFLQTVDSDMEPSRRRHLILYVRIIVAVALFALFAIFATSAALTETLGDKPFLLSGLLIGSVLILPRTARRPSREKEEGVGGEELARLQAIQKWLTWVRVAFFLMAIFFFLILPELV